MSILDAVAASVKARTARTAARTSKRCPRCDRDLPLADFYACPSHRGGGLSAYCRSCEISAALARQGKPRAADWAGASDVLTVDRSRRSAPLRAAATLAILADPDASNMEIGRRTGCSNNTASLARAELITNGQVQPRPPQPRAARFTRRPRQPADQTPRPQAPDWSRGWCSRVAPEHRSWWSSDDPDETEAARYMCASCEIRGPCESHALALTEAYGATTIWAGLTASERQARRLLLEDLAHQIRG